MENVVLIRLFLPHLAGKMPGEVAAEMEVIEDDGGIHPALQLVLEFLPQNPDDFLPIGEVPVQLLSPIGLPFKKNGPLRGR